MAKLIKKKKRGKIQIELTEDEQNILASLLWCKVTGSYDGPRGILTENDGNLFDLLIEAGANNYALKYDEYVKLEWKDDL